MTILDVVGHLGVYCILLALLGYSLVIAGSIAVHAIGWAIARGRRG